VPEAELAAYVDGLMGAYMRDDKIAGAVVAVVRKDRVLLLKGYGQDRADGRAVDARRTLFRIASISKTFTWLSLLQLIEEGKIDLDAPINTYLPEAARVADFGFDQPVLVRHLMTHTAGFEDAFAGRLFRADMRNAPTLADEQATDPPARVRPPGEAAIYSNYGSNLAGLIVQTVGGQEFQSRVEGRIFGPLGMQRTSFREPYEPMPGQPAPLSDALREDISKGFSWRAARAVERPFEFVTPNAPAGGASTTASDMARYMRMFLNKGELEGQRILAPETVAKLEAGPLFTNAPGVNGLAYGFMESRSRKGWRAYGHGGNTLWFASWMAIYPDLDFAVFVVGNTEGASRKLQIDVPRAIVDHFFPPNPATIEPPRADPSEAAALVRLAGDYLVDRRSYTTVQKMLCLVRCILTVSATPEGQIVIAGGVDVTRHTPVDVTATPGQPVVHRIRNVETGELSAFILAPGAPPRYVDAAGVSRATRIDWLQSPATFTLVANLALVFGGLAFVSGIWRAIRRRREGSETRIAGVLLPLAGAAWMVTFGALTAVLAIVSADIWVIFSAWPPQPLAIAQWGGLAASGLSAAALAAVVLGWRDADWSFWRRARIVLTLAVFAAAPLALAQWNLLGPR
jgi:CubicO group peptidase (beta-lactamase class C family)